MTDTPSPEPMPDDTLVMATRGNGDGTYDIDFVVTAGTRDEVDELAGNMGKVRALLADRDRLAKIVDEVRATIADDLVRLVDADELRAILSGEGK